MIFAAVDDAGVDLVGEHPEVVLDGEFRQTSLNRIGINRARWIAGRVGDEHARAARDLRGDLGEVRLEMVAGRELERYRNRAETERDRRIAGKAGIGIQDFVARLEQRHHGEKQGESCSRARARHSPAETVEIARAVQVGGDLLAQCGNAGDGAVAVFALGERFGGRLDHGLARDGNQARRVPDG